ncbi:MAG: hypothetical protein ACON4B_01635 [Flavobacteriaceae bacterium]
MRLATYIVSALALIIGVFNITKINFDAPLMGDSYTAVITTIAAGCAILLCSIIRVSKEVVNVVKQKIND